jgi:hypothetical protein
MNDAIEKAQMAFATAFSKLGKVNGKAGTGTEVAYAMAYQKLVALGVKPQIKGKYRV